MRPYHMRIEPQDHSHCTDAQLLRSRARLDFEIVPLQQYRKHKYHLAHGEETTRTIPIVSKDRAAVEGTVVELTMHVCRGQRTGKRPLC